MTQYLIRSKELKTYYSKKVDDISNHFVLDKDEAYIFKNKYEANKKIKKLGNNFEIVKK